MGTGLNRKESQPFAACLKGAKEPLMKSPAENLPQDTQQDESAAKREDS